MKATYIKSDDRSREEREPFPDSKVESVPIGKEGDGLRSPKLLFIIAEGEKTEQKFFGPINNNEEFSRVHVIYYSKGNSGLRPEEIASYWDRCKHLGTISNNGDTYDLTEMDAVYLVSDVDEKYENLKNILNPLPDEERSLWVISNPCFEIWLYYCFRDDPENDLKDIIPLGCDKRSQKMKELWKTINGNRPKGAFPLLDTGIAHAARRYREDEYHIPQLFSTRMYIVAKMIREMMEEWDNALKHYKERKKTQRDSYKKI